MFDNLKIVELGQGISAAYCTKLFADLGAEVIKVEPPDGDVARRRPPFLNDEPGLERSGLFAFLNTNKLGVTLDVSKHQDYDVLVRLLRDADILVENNSPQWMAASGLDYERLKAISPTLILTSITPFGQNGPWRDYLGNSFIVSHASGFAYDNGHIDADLETHPPLAIPCSMDEFLGGMAAASATICALLGRGSGGGGTHVDVALQEALASFLSHPISSVTHGGHAPGRKPGEELKVIIGQQPTADGYIDFTIRLEEMWRGLMQAMGNPAWNDDRLFGTSDARRKNPSRAWSLVGEETRRFKKKELVELCQARGVPAAPVNTVADLARDGHLQDREWFGEFDHPVLGHVRCPGPPVKIGDSRPSSEGRRPAPLLGQHNQEVGGRCVVSDQTETDACHSEYPRVPGTLREGQKLEVSEQPERTAANPPEADAPGVRTLRFAQGDKPQDQCGRPPGCTDAELATLFESGTSNSLPLKGIRIADFGWVLAAPYGTGLLARMGAEVIKVEGMSRPDNLRFNTPFADGVRGVNRSGWFNGINAGKLSVSLELANPEHVALAKELVAISDVVVENFSQGTMEKFGLGYDVLKRVRPDLIMASCSGFGRTGRLRTYRAFMSNINAYSGLSFLSGYSGEEPKYLGGIWCDHLAGMALTYAVLAALYQRRETGRGQYIDLSMLEAAASMLGVPFMDYFLNGRIAGRQGHGSTEASPNNVYRCKGDDAWVAISVETEEQWDALCRVIDDPELRERHEYRGGEGRSQGSADIDSRITRWTRNRTPLEVTELLQGAGVPSGPSGNAADLMEQPQLRARGFFIQQDQPEVGKREIMNIPWRLSGGQDVPGRPAPLYGEHNQYVIGTLLGRSQETIDRLNEERDRAISGAQSLF